MNTDNTLWIGQSSSRKQLIVLISLFALTIASFAGIIISSKQDNMILTGVMIGLFTLSIVPWVLVLILLKRSSLKWESDGLVFNVTENGIHVRSPKNEGIFLFVEWAKIAGYSIKQGAKGKATVIVDFNCEVYGNVLGNSKFLKMAGVTNVDELCDIFEKFGIKNMDIRKN